MGNQCFFSILALEKCMTKEIGSVKAGIEELLRRCDGNLLPIRDAKPPKISR